jgi:hypothetical protein
MNSQRAGHFTVTVRTRYRVRPKIRWSEGDVLQTLYFFCSM